MNASGIPIATLQRMAQDGNEGATNMLALLDERYGRYVAERRETLHAMTPAIVNPRPLRSKGEGVNGKEVRAAERWTQSKRPLRGPARRIAADPADIAALGSSFGILAALLRGETWQPMASRDADPAEDAAPRTTPLTAAQEHALRLLAIVGSADADADGSAS